MHFVHLHIYNYTHNYKICGMFGAKTQENSLKLEKMATFPSYKGRCMPYTNQLQGGPHKSIKATVYIRVLLATSWPWLGCILSQGNAVIKNVVFAINCVNNSSFITYCNLKYMNTLNIFM